MKLGKTNKHYTNYGRDNHDVNTCRMKKKEEPTIAATQATT
jgi:hypothetical protein